MRHVLPVFAGLLWIVGCGGGDDGGTTPPPPPPPDPPDISGLWTGTENVIYRGGSGCHPDIQNGLRTGDIFRVTQNGGQILIEQLVNCVICRFSGAITADGSFQARGSIPPASNRVTGQVSGDSMTATKVPLDSDCDKVSEYNLRR